MIIVSHKDDAAAFDGGSAASAASSSFVAPDVMPCEYLIIQLLNVKARDVAAMAIRAANW